MEWIPLTAPSLLNISLSFPPTLKITKKCKSNIPRPYYGILRNFKQFWEANLEPSWTSKMELIFAKKSPAVDVRRSWECSTELENVVLNLRMNFSLKLEWFLLYAFVFQDFRYFKCILVQTKFKFWIRDFSHYYKVLRKNLKIENFQKRTILYFVFYSKMLHPLRRRILFLLLLLFCFLLKNS